MAENAYLESLQGMRDKVVCTLKTLNSERGLEGPRTAQRRASLRQQIAELDMLIAAAQARRH